MNFPLQQSVSFWDLGSLNGCLYTREQGALVTSNTYVGYRRANHDVVMVGAEAFALLEKMPAVIESVPTIKDGVIADENLLYRLVLEWKAKIAIETIASLFVPPTAVVSVPSTIDPTHIRATTRVFKRAGFGRVILVPGILATHAFHFTKPKKQSVMVVDLGAGKVEVACIGSGSVMKSDVLHQGGDVIDSRICEWAQEVYSVSISRFDASNIKHHFSFLKTKKRDALQVRGKDKKNKIATISIKYEDIIPIIETFLEGVIVSCREVISGLSSRVVQDLEQEGILLCGGMSRLEGVDLWFKEKMSLPVSAVARPELASVLGAARLYANWDIYSESQLKAHGQ